jgi:recombination protein RecR
VRYTKELADLIEEFGKFPTIGPKSAQRMAFSLLRKSPEQVKKFIRIIDDAKTKISYCEKCFNLTSQSICEICLDPGRNQMQICVVESVKDLIALERTHEYKGVYHVLGGIISPLDGIVADDLNIDELIEKIRQALIAGEEIELILAIGLSTEGEATMLYIKRLIEYLKIDTGVCSITRLAHGLPVGADLDYADETTLAKALSARVLA